MITLVYIHSSQLSLRWLEYYYLDDLSKDYNVEYWDCSAIASPSFKAQPVIERNFVIIIDSYEKLKNNLKRISSKSLIINDLHTNYSNLKIYMLITKYFKNQIYINFFSNTIGAYKSKLLSKIVNSKLSDLFAWFIIHCRVKFHILTSKAGSKFRINHPDYDLFLKLKRSKQEDRNSFIVYIDNFFPFHPEIKKREPYINPNEISKLFYSSLNNFFSYIEKEYDCPVIILAHPSADYIQNPFEGRKIIKGKTGDFVQKASFVCMHTSNSVSFVILFNKPVALLSNQGYSKAILENKRLTTMAKEFNLKIINTDNFGTSNIFQNIDKETRNRYEEEFLKASDNENNLILFKKYFTELYQMINE